MAKVIYSLKNYLFLSQFRLPELDFNRSMHSHAATLNAATLYLRAWCTCMSPISAPRNYLELLNDFIAYIFLNKPVATCSYEDINAPFIVLK